MFKGAIFDLDGVITETSKLHYLAWRDTIKFYGISYTIKDNAKLKGLPRRDTVIAILKLKKKLNEFTNEQIDKICSDKNKLYVKLLKTLKPNDIFLNIKKILINLKKMGVKLSLASSSLNAPTILKKLKVDYLFDYIVNPLLVKHPKPSPDIYLLAAKGINLKPSECVGFEDAIAGIEGLNKAKIFSVGIDFNVKKVKELANISFTHPNKVKLSEIIKKYENK